MLKKCLLVSVILVMIFSLPTCGPSVEETTSPDQIVSFPDPNLEARIRSHISKPEGPIYVGDLKGITHINAIDFKISDLRGIEYCYNLRKLFIDRNSISVHGLEPFGSVTKQEIKRYRLHQKIQYPWLAALTTGMFFLIKFAITK